MDLLTLLWASRGRFRLRQPPYNQAPFPPLELGALAG